MINKLNEKIKKTGAPIVVGLEPYAFLSANAPAGCSRGRKG